MALKTEALFRDDSYLRICFAQDAGRLEQALERLEGAIRKL